jgi:hypothetical protein
MLDMTDDQGEGEKVDGLATLMESKCFALPYDLLLPLEPRSDMDLLQS